jgi:hypothetical protein
MGKQGPVQIYEDWFDAKMRNVHTMLPGKIEKYSGHSERKATVKPLVKFLTVDGQSLSIPSIPNVPVWFPSSGKFNFLFPINKDDGCIILFSESGIGKFLNGKTEVDADSLARFQLTDAICIPGLWSFKNVPDADSTIEIDNDGNINLNGDTRNLVSHTELNTALQAMITAINSTFATKLDGGGTPGTVSLDISTSKIDTVRAGQ